jgi:hypothetical protein
VTDAMVALPIYADIPRPVAHISLTRAADGMITGEWEGEPTWPVLVTEAFEAAAYEDWIERLPWRLVKTATIPSCAISVYRRLDG